MAATTAARLLIRKARRATALRSGSSGGGSDLTGDDRIGYCSADEHDA
jgi:hypothetical protein